MLEVTWQHVIYSKSSCGDVVVNNEVRELIGANNCFRLPAVLMHHLTVVRGGMSGGREFQRWGAERLKILDPMMAKWAGSRKSREEQEDLFRRERNKSVFNQMQFSPHGWGPTSLDHVTWKRQIGSGRLVNIHCCLGSIHFPTPCLWEAEKTKQKRGAGCYSLVLHASL